MSQSDFTHNNMVPFFGSRVRQNVETGGGQQARLEAHTGIPQNDIKRKRSSLFLNLNKICHTYLEHQIQMKC